MAGMYGIAAYRQTGSIWGLKNNATNRSGANGWIEENEVSDKTSASKQLRQKIRELTRTPDQDKNPYVTTSDDRSNGFLQLSGSPDSEEKEKTGKAVNYKYKEVATKIQQAKTSVSAARAVIAAKRKVLELKRKIASKEGDPEELQFALTHAKRMEMVARKKKHHLELEELVVNTQNSDENKDKMEETAADVKNAVVSAEEEKVALKEDAIFDEREEMIEEAYEEASDNGREISEEMLSKLNEMISEFGEEELEQLEETMEMLENMEIVDPHMSKEDLEDLKRKHRAKENKDMIKADMDYIKDMIKHQQYKAGVLGISGMSKGAVSISPTGSMSLTGSMSPTGDMSITHSVNLDISTPATTVAESGSYDVQV